MRKKILFLKNIVLYGFINSEYEGEEKLLVKFFAKFISIINTV